MTIDEIVEVLRGHPFMAGLEEPSLRAIAECTRTVDVSAGGFLAKEGEPAEDFFLIQSGRATIEIHSPRGGPVQIQTVDPGAVVGWSWLVPPHRWQFDVRAVEPVRAMAITAPRLRQLCEDNHELGYQLLRRLVAIIASRLAGTRLQLLDVFK